MACITQQHLLVGLYANQQGLKLKVLWIRGICGPHFQALACLFVEETYLRFTKPSLSVSLFKLSPFPRDISKCKALSSSKVRYIEFFDGASPASFIDAARQSEFPRREREERRRERGEREREGEIEKETNRPIVWQTALSSPSCVRRQN